MDIPADFANEALDRSLEQGLVVHIYDFEFPDRGRADKFFVVMSHDCKVEVIDLFVTTSQAEAFGHRPRGREGFFLPGDRYPRLAPGTTVDCTRILRREKNVLKQYFTTPARQSDPSKMILTTICKVEKEDMREIFTLVSASSAFSEVEKERLLPPK